MRAVLELRWVVVFLQQPLFEKGKPFHWPRECRQRFFVRFLESCLLAESKSEELDSRET